MCYAFFCQANANGWQLVVHATGFSRRFDGKKDECQVQEKVLRCRVGWNPGVNSGQVFSLPAFSTTVG